MAAAEEVDVEVGNGFAAVGAVVDDDAKTSVEFELLGDLASNEKEMAEQGLVFRGRFAYARNQFFGNDQNVDGRLRIDVADCEAELVLMFEVRGDFPLGYFLEERFFGKHGFKLKIRN